MPKPTKVLVIAYGNPLRRDDGAGLALAERLARRWRSLDIAVKHIGTHQLVPELAAEIAESNATHVVFVDTMPATDNVGIQFRTLDPSQTTMTLGHQSSPELLMYMAQHLYDVQTPAWLVTIPGTDFGHGEGFSAGVMALLARSHESVDDIAENITQYVVVTG